jgi:hypothetical protein
MEIRMSNFIGDVIGSRYEYTGKPKTPAYKVEWHHLTSPRGESFQGFWVMLQGQPVNDRPFDTKDQAKAFLLEVA